MSAVVIGVGNPLRRDDGVGAAIAARLRATAAAEVKTLEHVPPELHEHWGRAEQVFLVDASQPAGEPGRIRRFDPGSAPLPAGALRLSTHGFGLSEAIELARALDRLPPRLTVFAVEGADFASGAGLSPAVAAAADEVAARIQGELDAPSSRG